MTIIHSNTHHFLLYLHLNLNTNGEISPREGPRTNTVTSSIQICFHQSEVVIRKDSISVITTKNIVFHRQAHHSFVLLSVSQ